MNLPEPCAQLVLLDKHAPDLLHVLYTGRLNCAPKVHALLLDAEFSLLLGNLTEKLAACLDTS